MADRRIPPKTVSGRRAERHRNARSPLLMAMPHLGGAMLILLAAAWLLTSAPQDATSCGCGSTRPDFRWLLRTALVPSPSYGVESAAHGITPRAGVHLHVGPNGTHTITVNATPRYFARGKTRDLRAHVCAARWLSESPKAAHVSSEDGVALRRVLAALDALNGAGFEQAAMRLFDASARRPNIMRPSERYAPRRQLPPHAFPAALVRTCRAARRTVFAPRPRASHPNAARTPRSG